jgi:Na+/melibiose symporter-like transporter
VIFGALPLAISIVLLWIVPKELGDIGVFLWVVTTFILFDTMTNVPYYA